MIKPTLKLSEPAQIPQQFEAIVREFLITWWRDRQWEMEQEWGFTQIAPLSPDDLMRTPVAERLSIIARYVAGEEIERSYVLDSIQSISEHLFAIETVFEIPAEFWGTPIGWMILQALVRAEGDELLSLSQAAEITGKSLSSISQMVSRGRLTRYRDPTETNPQHATRVRRSELDDYLKRRQSNK
ncbi:DNA-binding protein [Candidatus Parcubacteria bacterium]|nr:MAG: DNA-binding protein [Candidatus Parcubacteria bacterium]